MNYQMSKKIVKEITMCSKTDTEILYEPDPDIDIEEFKQEPMNVSEMKSSDPDSVANETPISD